MHKHNSVRRKTKRGVTIAKGFKKKKKDKKSSRGGKGCCHLFMSDKNLRIRMKKKLDLETSILAKTRNEVNRVSVLFLFNG